MKKYFICIVLLILLSFIVKAQSPTPTDAPIEPPECYDAFDCAIGPNGATSDNSVCESRYAQNIYYYSCYSGNCQITDQTNCANGCTYGYDARGRYIAMCDEAPPPTTSPISIPYTSPSPYASAVPPTVPNLPCEPLDAIQLTNENKRLVRIFSHWITRTRTVTPSPSPSTSPGTITEIIPCVEPKICAGDTININGRCYDLGYPECPRSTGDIVEDNLAGTKTYTVNVGQPCITVHKRYGATTWHLLETDLRLMPYTALFAVGMPTVG
jgi:hypothetical protein